MKRRGKAALCLGMAGVMAAGTMLSGCGKEQTNGKVKIEVVQYKPEAVDVFEELEKKFNETHDNRFSERCHDYFKNKIYS